ncbi:hypothetical protein K3495_g8068 [Podosphaera aphanis]|nr:hypothetical protein K3495_g8068 [Podosphaera aphanis]
MLLNRLILAKLSKEIANQFAPDIIMVVRKPLHGIPEVGTHCWTTYHKHHQEKLGMEPSTYDPCLLITKNVGLFGIVGIQTDDTIILADDNFVLKEEDELVTGKLFAKPRERLSPGHPLIFNGCVISQNDDNATINMCQKEQGKKIKPVNPNSDYRQAYVEQRARSAYIATTCQPEVAYDLSVAAQHQEPTKDDVMALNKRLMW